MEAVVYNQKGKETGKVKLPDNVFGAKWNEALVHQVVTGMLANARTPLAHTKNRGEVSGTGRKPWKQKGTGQARHGSRRSPIWVGGGIAHGPRNERRFDRKINQKMRARALFSVLSRKLKDGEIIFLDNISLQKPKTAEAKGILNAIAKVKGFERISSRKNAAFLSLGVGSEPVWKSFQNLGNLEVGQTKDLNPVDVLKYKYLVIENPEKSLGVLSHRIK